MSCQLPKIKATQDFKTGKAHAALALPVDANSMNRGIHFHPSFLHVEESCLLIEIPIQIGVSSVNEMEYY